MRLFSTGTHGQKVQTMATMEDFLPPFD